MTSYQKLQISFFFLAMRSELLPNCTKQLAQLIQLIREPENSQEKASMELAIKIFEIVQLPFFNLSVITLKRRVLFTKRCLMRVVWLSFAYTIYISFAYKRNKHNDHLLNA